jgi:hypothetical protein
MSRLCGSDIQRAQRVARIGARRASREGDPAAECAAIAMSWPRLTTVPCLSCGAQIGFIERPAALTGRSGVKVPVNPYLVKTFRRPHVAGERAKRLMLVTERGELIYGVETTAADLSGEPVEGYVAHFATCSDPAAHRRPA